MRPGQTVMMGDGERPGFSLVGTVDFMENGDGFNIESRIEQTEDEIPNNEAFGNELK